MKNYILSPELVDIREIDFKDLFAYLFKKIIIIALITVLCTLASAFLSYRSFTNQKTIESVSDFPHAAQVLQIQNCQELYNHYDQEIKKLVDSNENDADLIIAYSYLMDDIDFEIKEAEKVLTAEEKIYLSTGEFVQTQSLNKSLIKGGVIGFVLGAVLSVCALALIYIFSNSIKTAKEMKIICESNVYSSKDNYVALIEAELSISKNIKNVLLVSSKDYNEMHIIEDHLKSIKNVKAVCDLVHDANSLKELEAYDTVIVVEKLHKSSYLDLIEEIEIIKKYQKSVFVSIAI